jgi:hypothetical protein
MIRGQSSAPKRERVLAAAAEDELATVISGSGDELDDSWRPRATVDSRKTSARSKALLVIGKSRRSPQELRGGKPARRGRFRDGVAGHTGLLRRRLAASQKTSGHEDFGVAEDEVEDLFDPIGA